MTKDEILSMARTAGFTPKSFFMEMKLKRFAELAIERKLEGMVMMTPEEFKSVWDKAQAEEREACAKEADAWSKRDDDVGAFIGKAIRARGQQ